MELLTLFAKFGLPGLALAVFYLLFRRFRWKFSPVPAKWAGPIAVLFLILTAGVVIFFASLGSTRTRDQTKDNDPSRPNVEIDTLGPAQKAPPFRIYFDDDKSHVTEEGKRLITKNVEWLATLGPYIKHVMLIGHTSIVGTEEYNRSLSDRLALAVREEMIAQGINGDLIETRSMGKETASPLFQSANPRTGRDYNRYVELTVIK